MQKKKQTNGQLQQRIEKALLHIDKTKDTRSIYFSDKGLRLVVNEDYAIIETGFHRHVFANFTSAGVSRPYLYTQRIIEIAESNDCHTDSGYSFAKLLDCLKSKEDSTEYNLTVYYEWWLRLIFDSLYNIAEDEVSSWLVYFKYVTTLAINSILLDEHKEDFTNKEFIKRFIENVREFTYGIDERVLLHAMSDEERVNAVAAAIQEQEQEQAMEAQTNGAE